MALGRSETGHADGFDPGLHLPFFELSTADRQGGDLAIVLGRDITVTGMLHDLRILQFDRITIDIAAFETKTL